MAKGRMAIISHNYWGQGDIRQIVEGKGNVWTGVKLIGIGCTRLSTGIGEHKGVSPCQTVAMLSRFITCHTRHITHVTSHTSHCVRCVTIFYLTLKQKKYHKCFPSRCWYVPSDTLKEKTALGAKMYLCNPCNM